MSTTRYMEFDSTYRDRGQYPSPARFVVEISQTGNKTKESAVDPVSLASPILTWNSSFREDTAATSVDISVPARGTVSGDTVSDSKTFLITAVAGRLRLITEYYRGCSVTLTNTAGTPVVFTTRITAYRYIDSAATDIAQITVSDPLPDGFITSAISATGTISNPTNATNSAEVPRVFVPAGIVGENFYVNFYVENISTGESFKITYYDGTLAMATLEDNTALTWLVSNNNFAIRRARPAYRGTLVAAQSTVLQLPSTLSSESGVYTGSFVRMLTPVPVAPFSTEVAPYGEEVKVGAYVAGDGTLASQATIGTSTFTLSAATASSRDGYYVGSLITIGSDTFRITSYTGLTRSGTVSSTWTATYAAGVAWYMRSAILTGTFGATPSAGDSFELEAFTRDNCTPFVYTGSLVSSQETVCYEVELINLILPNSLLSCGRGGRAVFYPYMYVELQQISSTGGIHKNTMYSNNPNSVRMLFRAVVDDTTQPVSSPFIKIDSDSMTHSIKFKPNDSFLFSVYLPNGELFSTVAQDYFSPTEPNPLVQISACFSFRRI